MARLSCWKMESFTSTMTSMGTTQPWRRFWRRAIRIPGESQLPLTQASNVHMHKVGTAIVTNSPAMQAQRGIPHCCRRNPRYANVDGFCLHVKTMTSHARVCAAGTQEFVAPWRAVSADHVDLTAGIVQGRGQIV